MNSETEFYVLSALWNGYLKAITQVRGPTLILSSKDVQSMLELRSTAAKILGGETNDHRVHQPTNQVQPLGKAGDLSPREGIPSTGSSENFRLVPRREKSIRESETQDGSDKSLGESERDHSTDGEAESDYERNTVNLAYRLSIMADKALLLAYNYWHDVEINRTRLGSSANCIAKKSLFLCQQEFKKRNMQIPIL